MNEVTKPKSATSMFFKLGDKVTGGDPKRKADFDYYLLWVMFLAFCSIGFSSVVTGINLVKIGEVWLAVKSFGWAFIMIAIVWFQYGALKQTWQNRNRIKALPQVNNLKIDDKPLEEDSIKEMEGEFEDE